MHLVKKVIKGSDYYYLVEKRRDGKRVRTSRTVYIGGWKKLAELVQGQIAGAFPTSFSAQEVGGSLALVDVACDLGIEELIDEICPVRSGSTPIGRQILLMAVHRALSPRWANSKKNLEEVYAGSALAELLPLPEKAVDNRRLDETLSSLTTRQIERIEGAVVERLIEREAIRLDLLAFDTTNFDSYAAASTESRLLKRGHGKSGRPLRVLGLGLLVTEDDGLPLLTFTYPGNENDVTAFARFLSSLDRRQPRLKLPADATIVADGGNISKEVLKRLEDRPRHYVLRLPAKHASGLARPASLELPELGGRLKGKVRASKQHCLVYGAKRYVVDVYSHRMHHRQLPGLRRDRDKARSDLQHLQRQLEKQRQGKRHAEPITSVSLRQRVAKALAREHMTELFLVTIGASEETPMLSFDEPPAAWEHLQTHVLGRTLLVSDRGDWSAERIVEASRQQADNERFFRDAKAPEGASMLPLRHRGDAALRANALCVVLGLALTKVLQRRLRLAGVKTASASSLLRSLRRVKRARLKLPDGAPPALRAFAKAAWVPSERTARQADILGALKLDKRPELGATLFSAKA
jgi:transposase